jgi:hypothetical protein
MLRIEADPQHAKAFRLVDTDTGEVVMEHITLKGKTELAAYQEAKRLRDEFSLETAR